MGALRSWLLAITAASFAVALAQALTPDGTVKKVGKLVGGLVLLLAVVRPVLLLDVEDLAVKAAFYEGIPAAVRTDVLAVYIADSTEAYIAQQASELGIDCTASVSVETDENGWPLPEGVTLSGDCSPEAEQKLRERLAAELAIPVENVVFREMER